MKPTVGTVLSMSPASGVVRFDLEGERWTLPLVGFAVAVRWRADLDDIDVDGDQYETGLEPVVMAEDRYPVPLDQHCGDLTTSGRPGLRVRVELNR